MFDAVDWEDHWTWCQPDPEAIAYFSRTGEDSYTRYDMLAIRTKRLGVKEDELGPIVIAPNASSDWVIWRTWLDQSGCPLPKLDDYFVDAKGAAWSVTSVNTKLREQFVELTNCCSMNSPFPAGV